MHWMITEICLNRKQLVAKFEGKKKSWKRTWKGGQRKTMNCKTLHNSSWQINSCLFIQIYLEKLYTKFSIYLLGFFYEKNNNLWACRSMTYIKYHLTITVICKITILFSYNKLIINFCFVVLDFSSIPVIVFF